MATISRGYSFGSTEQVTAAKLHSLVDSASISGIATADLSNSSVTNAKVSDVSCAKLTNCADLPSGSGVFPVANTNACLLSGNQTVAGIKTFSSFPLTPSSDPSSAYQVANKNYVDDRALVVSSATASYSGDTTYLAAKNLFISGYTSYDSTPKTIELLTDAGNPPTTVKSRQQTGINSANTQLSGHMIVKRGDYWQVAVSGAGVTVTISVTELN